MKDNNKVKPNNSRSLIICSFVITCLICAIGFIIITTDSATIKAAVGIIVDICFMGLLFILLWFAVYLVILLVKTTVDDIKHEKSKKE